MAVYGRGNGLLAPSAVLSRSRAVSPLIAVPSRAEVDRMSPVHSTVKKHQIPAAIGGRSCVATRIGRVGGGQVFS